KPEHTKEQRDHDVHAGKVRRDMAGPRSVGHLQRREATLYGCCFEPQQLGSRDFLANTRPLKAGHLSFCMSTCHRTETSSKRADPLDGHRRSIMIALDTICSLLHPRPLDRKSTRLNSSHVKISYAVFCLKKKMTF